jgi:hypothetical protein
VQLPKLIIGKQYRINMVKGWMRQAMVNSGFKGNPFTRLTQGP